MGNIKTFDRIHRINRITAEMDALYHQAALKLNLSDSSMFILYTIYEKGGRCPLNEINNSGICKQTINSAIRRLEAEGILYLEPLKGKSKIAVLTEKGEAFSMQTAARLLDAEEQAFGSWTEDEINAFIELNKKYLDCFKEQIEKI